MNQKESNRSFSDLFRFVFSQVVLRKRIIKFIGVIHSEFRDKENNALKRYNWNQLSFHPSQLLIYNYIDRYIVEFKEKIIPLLNSKSFNRYDTLFERYLSSIFDAASRNHVVIVKLLHEHCQQYFHYSYYQRAACGAASKGNLDVIKYLHSISSSSATTASSDISSSSYNNYKEPNMKSFTSDCMDWASSAGRLEIIEFLHNNRSEGWSLYAYEWAAKNGHLETLQFLLENRTNSVLNLSVNVMDMAAKNGHLEIVKLLHNNSQSCSKKAIDLAAKHGHLDVIKFLHENRTEGCTRNALTYAMDQNNKELFNYLENVVKLMTVMPVK